MATPPVAGLPNPQSYDQLNSDMLSTYATKIGIDDFNVGSAVTSFFETVALTTARASGDIFQILRDFSIDRATGDALKNLAIENRVTPLTARPATGPVNVVDTSFNKIATKVYAGAMPPNVGSVAISVSDASAFPSTGSVYIGRGTPNVEGPLPYSSITPSGGFFIINLSVPTTKFHNIGEAVILAQGGNRSVPINAIVVSPALGSSPDIQFNVIAPAVILDGETTVTGVQVSALSPGSAGNIPAGAIKKFASPPFSGATVSNALPFTTGQDSETDDSLRVRIKRAIASTGLGTATAVQSAVIGATPSDEQATVVSDSLILNTNGAILYIDSGNGYEAKSQGVGLESIVDSALGGEQFFQLATGGRQAPVAKAFLQSTFTAPYDLIGGDTLAVTVGEVTYQHIFANADFISPGGATAFEVTASINADTALGFEATTAGGGTLVVIRSKTEGNDSIQAVKPTTSGRDAAVQLGFPSNKVETLRLYRNKVPLSKDGAEATIFTQAQALWSPAIANGDTLIISVDGTAPITYTFFDADFVATGLYTTVNATNSLESWRQVLIAKLTGVTTAIIGQQLTITSNLGDNNRAQVVIDPSSTLVTKGMFSVIIGLTSQGKASDFILSRNTAQFELVVPLVTGDQLSAGSDQTEARIESSDIPGSSIIFSADAHFWLLIDNPGQVIPNGVAGNTVLVVSKPLTNTVRYTSSNANAFVNVVAGDYLIVWSAELNANNRFEGRVNARTNSTLDIVVTASEYAAAVPESIVFNDGFVTTRTTLAPQRFRVTSGNKSLDQIAQELQTQTSELIFSVQQESFLVVRTVTKDANGYLLVVTADVQGKLLLLPLNTSSISQESLIAYYDSATKDAQMPLFVHSTFSSGVHANPPDTFINSATSTYSFAGRDPNELISMLQPYGQIRDEQPYGEYDQITTISGTVIGLENQSLLHRLRVADRFYIANPLDFGSADTMVVVLDNNPSTESFEIPLYRRAITNTSQANNPSNFNAYDVDSGVTANFVTAFGTFDFSNFKALMKAKKVLKQTAPQTAILYRATKWGRSGEKITIAYTYPTQPSSAIGSNVSVGATIDITLNTASGPAIPSAIDATTEWNITVTPNFPVAGVDQVKYTWNGVGTAPALTLTGGEYVNITDQTEFATANTGIYRVSTAAGFTPTSTSFSVQKPTGTGVPQANVATNVLGAITFYQAVPTTAAQMVAYVNANLTDITATLVNDGGMTGSGVLTFSTFEDSNFATSRIQLLDGINWILSSNLGGSPQFTFKVPLNESTDVGYAFNNGEEVRLIPTTQEQVRRLISVLAVTGFTTTGTVGVVERGSRLELATRILGSQGAIQIIGGYGNGYQVPILDSSARLDNTLMKVSVDKVASAGVHSDQWFRLQATTAQAKEDAFGSNTGVTIQSNNPVTGRSLITLTGRQLNQRYFGKPRNFIRSENDTFRIEKQGALVCLSWTGLGTDPQFQKTLNFNDTGGASPAPIVTVSEPFTFGGLNFTNSTGFFSQAFQIPAGPNQAVTQIQVDVIQNGGAVTPNAPIVMEIRAATSSVPDHFPTGPVLATSNPVLANTLPTSDGTMTTFTFPTLVPLTNNGFYSFSLRATVPVTVNTLRVGGMAPVLAGFRAAQTTNGGASWTSFGNGAFAEYTITAESVVVGTLNVLAIPNSNDSQYIIETGNVNFNELSIGDLLTVAGLPKAANNGTFLVTGVSTDGKTVEVLNPVAQDEFSSGTFTFSGNSTAGDAFTVSTTTLVAGTDFPIGGTSQITATNLAAAIGTIPGVTAAANGNVVTVTAASASANIPISYSGTGVITVSGSVLVGDSFTSGQFSSIGQVSEGDTMVVGSPFSILNQGRYRVIRRFNNSVWFENPNVIEEEVTLPPNLIALDFDATTSFKVDASNNSEYLKWNGIGTEPHLGNAQAGDVVTFGTDFAAANQGTFAVLRSGIKLPELTQLTTTTGAVFTLGGPGVYFLLNSAGNVQMYYVWYNVNGSNSDPAGPGTGIMVAILSGDNAIQVATKTAFAINGATGLTATSASNIVSVATTDSIETTHATNFNVPSPFSIFLAQAGRRTFLEAINPMAQTQNTVLVSTDILEDHRPQLQFFEYEATVANDLFTITSDVLGATNQGSWVIDQVIDQNTAIVNATLAPALNVSLNGSESAVFVSEGTPYTGYKHVLLVALQPGAPTRNNIVFDTNAQSEKIDGSAGVQMVSLGKEEFNTVIRTGLDSYRFNTGLIAEANRIIYGDPRDPVTYPGVGAAGAEIFVQEPLTRRIQISLVVRVNTGVPFSQIISQVRSSVSSLINSNPVGVPIAIGDIVAIVKAIPGVRAEAISSPQYDSTHDLIFIAPSEKARILDPTLDISVSQIGS